MTTLIEKVANIYVWENRKLGEAVTHQILAVVHAHYGDPANVSDAMVEAAIMSWDTAETEGVLDDWKHAIAAAMKATLTES